MKQPKEGTSCRLGLSPSTPQSWTDSILAIREKEVEERALSAIASDVSRHEPVYGYHSRLPVTVGNGRHVTESASLAPAQGTPQPSRKAAAGLSDREARVALFENLTLLFQVQSAAVRVSQRLHAAKLSRIRREGGEAAASPFSTTRASEAFAFHPVYTWPSPSTRGDTEGLPPCAWTEETAGGAADHHGTATLFSRVIPRQLARERRPFHSQSAHLVGTAFPLFTLNVEEAAAQERAVYKHGGGADGGDSPALSTSPPLTDQADDAALCRALDRIPQPPVSLASYTGPTHASGTGAAVTLFPVCPPGHGQGLGEAAALSAAARIGVTRGSDSTTADARGPADAQESHADAAGVGRHGESVAALRGGVVPSSPPPTRHDALVGDMDASGDLVNHRSEDKVRAMQGNGERGLALPPARGRYCPAWAPSSIAERASAVLDKLSTDCDNGHAIADPANYLTTFTRAFDM